VNPIVRQMPQCGLAQSVESLGKMRVEKEENLVCARFGNHRLGQRARVSANAT
jgi:hypothetical protein